MEQNLGQLLSASGGVSAPLALTSSSHTPPPGPPATRLKKLSFTHESLALWLFANPEASLGDAALHFGYSRGWISIVTHSAMFKARMRELQGMADAAVINDIPAKMRGVASLALEGLADQVEMAVEDASVGNRDFLLSTSEKLLKSLGYGQPKTPGVTINNPTGPVLVASADDLARARELMARRQQAPAETPPIDVTPSASAA